MIKYLETLANSDAFRLLILISTTNMTQPVVDSVYLFYFIFWSENFKLWKLPFIFVRSGWKPFPVRTFQFGWGSEDWTINDWSLVLEILKVFPKKADFWPFSLYNRRLPFCAWAKKSSLIKIFIFSFLGLRNGYILRLRCLLGWLIQKIKSDIKNASYYGRPTY